MSYFTHQFLGAVVRSDLVGGNQLFPAAAKRRRGRVTAAHQCPPLQWRAGRHGDDGEYFFRHDAGAIDDLQLMDEEFMIRHAARTVENFLNA